MTPYTTPRYGQATPGQGTTHPMALASPHQQQAAQSQQTTPTQGVFLHPGSITPAQRTPSHQAAYQAARSGTVAAEDWRKAAEEWAKKRKDTSASNTPRSETRSTPRRLADIYLLQNLKFILHIEQPVSNIGNIFNNKTEYSFQNTAWQVSSVFHSTLTSRFF